jgi:ABC-2 type transport system permease protein
MNPPSNAGFPLEPRELAPEALAPVRPMYWSVRRELWENRSLYVGPLAAAAVILFGFLISLFSLPRRMRALPSLTPEKQHDLVAMPYSVAAVLIIATAFLVGVFYCLDALNSERRDRSILFWKSLPVSDLTTVLSKISIPLVVLPLFIFAVIIATQLIMLLVSTAVLLGSGLGAGPLWARVPLFRMSLALLYGLTVIALWQAPLYGWLLLASAWARRAVFLWAVLPLLAIGAIERIAFNTSHIGAFMKYRLVGWFAEAFSYKSMGGVPADPLASLAPGKFLSAPALWIGLAFGAAFIAAAVRLRRNREPI